MASGIFAVLDDIAALMDDVAMASKLATKKTAGILGDDLAVNAEKATGFLESREIPVLWAITKGSFLNKLIIVPIILALNAFLPIATKILLVIGGIYLAYEGVEKIIHFLFHREKKGEEVIIENNLDDREAEKTKVRSAIITDFILSLEIVIIALSTVLEEPLTTQILTVSIVAIIATIGVYGIVALIVRMDDAGYKLISKSGEKGILNWVGNLLVKTLPIIIKGLGIVGTIALLLVSGQIFVHQIDYLHHLFPNIPSIIKEVSCSILVGVVAFLVIEGSKKIFTKSSGSH